MKKVIAFAGSNSSKSINHQLIEATAKIAEGFEVEVIQLKDYEAPIYGIDLELSNGFPESMSKLKAKFDSAAGFIISSPEHNGSIPAVLKNSLDWISRMGSPIFQDKPVLFMATSPGPRGGASVLKHLLEIMPFRGAKITGSFSLPSFSENFENAALTGEHKTKLSEELAKLHDALNI